MSDSNEKMKATFLRLREEFLQICWQRVEAIDRAWAEGDGLETIRREAHTIAGASGSYGYDDVSSAASALEAAADRLMASGGGTEDSAARDAFCRSMQSLRKNAEQMLGNPDIGKIPF